MKSDFVDSPEGIPYLLHNLKCRDNFVKEFPMYLPKAESVFCD
jgi:hypothetical protein